MARYRSQARVEDFADALDDITVAIIEGALLRRVAGKYRSYATFMHQWHADGASERG